MELPEVVHEGQVIRFCQQCGRFHLLAEFDGDRRSCRRKLQRHNERRRMAEEAREAELALQRSLNLKIPRSSSHTINTNISHLDPSHPAIVDLLRQVGVHTHPPPPPNQHLAYRPQMFPPTEYHPAPPPPRSQYGLTPGKSPWRPFSEAAQQQQVARPTEQVPEEHSHPTIDPALLALLEPMLASAAATAVQEQLQQQQQQQQHQGSAPYYQEYQQQQQQYQGGEAAPTEMETGYVDDNNDNAAMIESMLLEQLKLCLSQTEYKTVDGNGGDNGATTSAAAAAAGVADAGATHINIAGLQSVSANTEGGGDAKMQSAADHLLALFNALNNNNNDNDITEEGTVAENGNEGMEYNATTTSATTTNTTATTTATTSQQQQRQQQQQLQREALSPSPGTTVDNTTTQPGALPVNATTTTGTTTPAVSELPDIAAVDGPIDNIPNTAILAAAVAALQTSASPLNTTISGGGCDGVALHPSSSHQINTSAIANVDTDALLRDIQAVAVSIKLFKVVPADLPPTLLQDLQQFINANPESLEAAMRPGCVHIGATVLLTSQEARRLADNLGALANRLAERGDLRDTAVIQISSTHVSRTALFGDNRVTMVLDQQGGGAEHGRGVHLDRTEMRQTPREGQVPPFVRPLAAVPLYNGPVVLMGHGLGSYDARVYCRHHSKYHSLVEVVRRGAILISNNGVEDDDVIEGVDTPDQHTENSDGDDAIFEYSDNILADNNREDELGYVHLHLPRLTEVGSYTFEAQQHGVTLLHPGPLPTMLVVDDPDVVEEVREMEVPGFDGGRWSHQDVAAFIALMGFVLNKYVEMVEHNHKVGKMILGGGIGSNSGDNVADDSGNAPITPAPGKAAAPPFAMKKQLDVRVKKAAQNIVAKCLKYGWSSTIELYLPACMGGQDDGEMVDGDDVDDFKHAVKGIRAALKGVPVLHAAIASGSIDTVIALWKWQRQLQKLGGGGSVGECYRQSSWSLQLLKASKKKNKIGDDEVKKGRKSSSASAVAAALCPLYVVASLQNPIEMARLLHRLSPELTPMWTECESDDGCWPCPLAFAAVLGKNDLVEVVQSLLKGAAGGKAGGGADTEGEAAIPESSWEKKLRIIEKAEHHQDYHGASTQYRFRPVVLLLILLTLQMALLDKFAQFNLIAIPFGLVLALLPVISFSYRCS